MEVKFSVEVEFCDEVEFCVEVDDGYFMQVIFFFLILWAHSFQIYSIQFFENVESKVLKAIWDALSPPLSHFSMYYYPHRLSLKKNNWRAVRIAWSNLY